MDNIQDIFNGNSSPNKHPRIIIPIEVDTKSHKEGILRIAQLIEPNFMQRNSFMQTFSVLFEYFTGKALDPNLGIWISGTVGTGKTLLFQIFKKYTSEILRENSFKMLIYRELLANYISGKKESIGKYQYSPVLIDDLGAGLIDVNRFGNEENFIDDLIEFRYRALKDNKMLTHISTNMYPGQFKGIVDDRTYSRMHEMFNLLELRGKDFRMEKYKLTDKQF